jgi:hypothetical protein
LHAEQQSDTLTALIKLLSPARQMGHVRAKTTSDLSRAPSDGGGPALYEHNEGTPVRSTSDVIFVFASLRLHYRNSEIPFRSSSYASPKREKDRTENLAVCKVKALFTSSMDNPSLYSSIPETHSEIWKNTRTTEYQSLRMGIS